MKYLYFFIITLLITTSCKLYKSYKAYFNQEFHANLAVPYKFELENGQIFISVKHNDSTYKMIFDTGYSTTLLYHEDFLEDFTLIKERKVKIPYKDFPLIVKQGTVSHLDYGFLQVNNHEVMYSNAVQYQPNPCNKDGFDGIVGMSIFSFLKADSCKYILNLRFSDSTITLFDDVQQVPELKAYKQLYSKFRSFKHPQLYFNLTEDETDSTKFLFDTGFDGEFMIKSEKTFKNSVKDSLKTINFHHLLETKSGPKSVMLDYKWFKTEVPFLEETKKIHVMFNKNISYNLLGMEFIKQYDWVIDFVNKTIYVKKNAVQQRLSNIHNVAYKIDYVVSVQGGKLVISHASEDFDTYPLGAIITKVNNIEVTEENMCEMQELIHKNVYANDSIKEEIVLEWVKE